MQRPLEPVAIPGLATTPHVTVGIVPLTIQNRSKIIKGFSYAAPKKYHRFRPR